MGFDIDKYLEKAMNGELLNELAIKLLCMKIKEIFIEEPNIKILSSPVTLVGDIHGQFYDLKELFKVGGEPPSTNYLFLGDYVDRGAHSVEVITLLCLLKVKYPLRVTLIRGNHETRGITQNYGFYMECQTKFGNTMVWEYFTDVFDFVPVGALIDSVFLCVHGGLSPSLETLKDITELNRFQEIPHEGPFTDLMWSDPDTENGGFSLSPRGAGYLFGEDAFDKFLHMNNITHMARAHQLCMEGYLVLFKERFYTVWSAPNYLYRFGNLASILEIDENLNAIFNVFTDSPDNLKKNLMATGIQGSSSTDKNYFM